MSLHEPPSNAPAATKMKYRKGEIKAKMIIGILFISTWLLTFMR